MSTQAELLKRIEELEQQLKVKKSTSGIKVSAKGGVSVYRLGRFPVTLYAKQWKTLMKRIPDIEKFINDNDDKLTKKNEEEK
jgi:hypothetical protein